MDRERQTAHRSQAFMAWCLGTGLALAVVGLLVLGDPAGVWWLPKCPLYQMTGWHCPGCGITRAAHALVQLDLAAAWRMNPLVVTAAPLVAGYCGWMRYRVGRGWTTAISPRAIAGFMAAVIVFAVLRNLPGYPFELLAPHKAADAKEISASP